jgi:hypothetical protein
MADRTADCRTRGPTPVVVEDPKSTGIDVVVAMAAKISRGGSKSRPLGLLKISRGTSGSVLSAALTAKISLEGSKSWSLELWKIS